VTLRGTVRSLHQRRVAIDLAKSARGRGRTSSSTRATTDDTQIRGAALNTLLADPHVPATVDATVASGWLTQSGRVKHQFESNAAFEAVARLPHVGGITNKIQVVTSGGY
jgi:osmotically-inducible protein OsmY